MIENFGHRADRWAVFAVSFSPQDDQRLVVVPVTWVHVFRNRYMMVNVPHPDFVVPSNEEVELPQMNWEFYPVVLCPEGGVVYETLGLALGKRARVLRRGHF